MQVSKKFDDLMNVGCQKQKHGNQLSQQSLANLPQALKVWAQILSQESQHQVQEHRELSCLRNTPGKSGCNLKVLGQARTLAFCNSGGSNVSVSPLLIVAQCVRQHAGLLLKVPSMLVENWVVGDGVPSLLVQSILSWNLVFFVQCCDVLFFRWRYPAKIIAFHV